MLEYLRTTQPDLLVPPVHELLHGGHNVLGDHDGAVVGLPRGAQDRFRAVQVHLVVGRIVDQAVDRLDTTYRG